MNIQFAIRLISLASVMAIAGCGGSNGGESIGISSTARIGPSGVWSGVMTAEDESTKNSLGLITDSGAVFFITAFEEMIGGYISESISGTYSTEGNSFTGRGYKWSIFDRKDVVVYAGEFITGREFSGSILRQSEPGSTFTYTYDSVNLRGSSLEAISGIYSRTDAGFTRTLTIDIDGGITGSNTNGCTFGGNVSLDDTNYNLYDITFTFECGSGSSTFQGIGALIDETEENDTLVMALEGTDYIITDFIPRT